MIIIPHNEFDPDVLQAVLEEYISREGTDYGLYEYTLEQKLEQLLKQIKQGNAFVCFDEETQSCTILNKDQAQFIQEPFIQESFVREP